MKNLRDRWVLVTGAASGIGNALSIEFANHGAHIILADIDETGMQNTARQVEAKGTKVICLRADMGCEDDVRSLARDALEKAGQVDVVVNNAGIGILADARDTSWPEWEKVLAINLHGPILLIHELLPHLTSRGSGHIVNIASIAGVVGYPGLSHYCVTKFGLVGYSQAIRGELASHGVGVTVVCPGVVRTAILGKMPFKGFDKSKFPDYPPLITLTAQKAAQQIVRAVKRNKGKVFVVNALSRFIFFMDRLFPRRLGDWFFLKFFYGRIKETTVQKMEEKVDTKSP